MSGRKSYEQITKKIFSFSNFFTCECKFLSILLLEIQDFLSEQECDDIIFMAKTQGLERSKTLGEKVPDGEEQSPNRTAERNVPENPAETFLHLDLNADGSMDVAEVGNRCILCKIVIHSRESFN